MRICHHCADYMTESIGNMSKHFKIKHPCSSNTLYTYEDAEKLSKDRDYLFMIDRRNLELSDYIFIVTYYTNKENIIKKGFKSKKLVEENEKIEMAKEEEEKSFQKHECPNCKKRFCAKYNLERHMENPNACVRKSCLKEIKKKNQEIIQQIQHNHNHNNFYTTQNIQNISNNNNNTNHNTYHVSIKDFIKENYDLSHISNDFYARKDFFLYPNLLRMIMENKKNHNIFFSNGEAIIYTDNELNRMSSDKAGYLILDKLNKSFNEILYQQDDETQQYYHFISKYYYVIKGHYKHDTIFKDYDVEEQQFVYTASSSLFRSRDKYLAKMMSTLDVCKDSAKKHMYFNIDEIRNIPTLNPNIEDFASAKMRYRDLKD